MNQNVLNDELETIWKEAEVATFEGIFRNVLGGIDRNHEFNRESWFPNRVSKAVSPKPKSQASPFEPICYVKNTRSGTNYGRGNETQKN